MRGPAAPWPRAPRCQPPSTGTAARGARSADAALLFLARPADRHPRIRHQRGRDSCCSSRRATRHPAAGAVPYGAAPSCTRPAHPIVSGTGPIVGQVDRVVRGESSRRGRRSATVATSRRPAPGPAAHCPPDDTQSRARHCRERLAEGERRRGRLGRRVRPTCAVERRPGRVAAAQQVQPLGEQFLEVLDGAPLQQHVPVRARTGLTGLRSGFSPCRRSASAPQLALPHRRHLLGLDREGDSRDVPRSGSRRSPLPGSQLDVLVVLVARRPESCASQCALAHVMPSSRGDRPRPVPGIVVPNAADGVGVPRVPRA